MHSTQLASRVAMLPSLTAPRLQGTTHTVFHLHMFIGSEGCFSWGFRSSARSAAVHYLADVAFGCTECAAGVRGGDGFAYLIVLLGVSPSSFVFG